MLLRLAVSSLTIFMVSHMNFNVTDKLTDLNALLVMEVTGSLFNRLRLEPSHKTSGSKQVSFLLPIRKRRIISGHLSTENMFSWFMIM